MQVSSCMYDTDRAREVHVQYISRMVVLTVAKNYAYFN